MRLGETQRFASPEEASAHLAKQEKWGVIEHHGVKGMKWGVRKEDAGSLADAKYPANVRTVYANKIQKNVDTYQGRIDRVKAGKGSFADKYRVGPSIPKAQAKADLYSAHADRVRNNKMTTKDKLLLAKGIKTDVLIDALFDQAPHKQSTLEKAVRHPATKFAVKTATSVAISKATAPVTAPVQKKIVETLLHEEGVTSEDQEVLSRVDALSDLGEAFVSHHGVKGMKWGVRKDGSTASGLFKSETPGVPAKTDRRAKKDAEEFTKAKLYYGQGAGTRRKLIKAKVEAESKKDPLYKKAFDHHVAKTDLSKRAKQATKQRKRTDRKDSIKKNARKSGLNDFVRDQAVKKILEQDALTEAGEAFISHHGVKGMKWGVRKEADPTGREKTKGDEVGVVDPVSLAITSMYAAMAVGLVVRQIRYARDGGENHEKANRDVPWQKKPELSKKMSVDELHKNVVKQINPDFPKSGTKMNCRRCTFAYEMRRRGNDVEATKSRYAKGQDGEGLAKATKYHNLRKLPESPWGENQIATPHIMATSKSADRGKHIFDALNKEPEGARGELGVGWFPFGGHSMAWEKVDGQAHIFDTQSGKRYSSPKDLKEMTDIMHDAAYTRTDNLKLDEKFLRRWMVNAR